MVLSITSGTPVGGDGGHLFDVEDVHARVGDGLAVEGARLGSDGFAEILGRPAPRTSR